MNEHAKGMLNSEMKSIQKDGFDGTNESSSMA